MRPPAKHRNAHTFQITDHQLWIVALHTGMWKTRQIGIVDRRAGNRVGQMAKTRPQYQPKLNRITPGAGADQPDQIVSVP